MKELPQEFCEKMQDLLGEEYDAYRQSMKQDSYTAVRINTNKISVEAWDEICPFEQKPVPWTDKGRYYDSAQNQPSKHPYYFAGLYYIQEPSAMIPASFLPVQPGDRVLDLCAAPGGKATEIAAKLQGKGILVANDISVSRTMALAKNLQVAGAVNAVVTAETPMHLAEHFQEYFDALLIDAPCSGEVMFRRDPH
ncbi:MAG: SAM-dependent methyltransferase, partial [Lachnospiraceae bacterium]|nr:SAM-dependent methyltransferase [Lachnospiraceae bacterium]